MPLDIPIVYADDSLIVLDKPAGLLAVPGRGSDKADCVSARVQQYYPQALIVHRLDQATSGLMLMGQGSAMQRALSALFEARQVHKSYKAVVHGLVALDHGSIDLPIAADWPARPRRKIDLEHGKNALTHYRVLARDTVSHTTRVHLEPVTGRTHQLRVHMLALGHAIVGDRLYGEDAAPRLLLHAAQLQLVHPVSQAPMAWQSQADF